MRRSQFLIASLGTIVAPSILLGRRKNYSLKYQWENLTDQQKEVRDRAYAAGLPSYPNTLTAIAWQESSFGLPDKMENPKDPSGGVFGNSYVTVARRHFRLGYSITAKGKVRYIMPTNAQVDYVRTQLLSSFSYSVYHALETLDEGKRHVTNVLIKEEAGPKTDILYSRRFRGRDWLRVWSYYNGGTKGSPEYAEEIREKVKFMATVNYKGG